MPSCQAVHLSPFLGQGDLLWGGQFLEVRAPLVCHVSLILHDPCSLAESGKPITRGWRPAGAVILGLVVKGPERGLVVALLSGHHVAGVLTTSCAVLGEHGGRSAEVGRAVGVLGDALGSSSGDGPSWWVLVLGCRASHGCLWSALAGASFRCTYSGESPGQEQGLS